MAVLRIISILIILGTIYAVNGQSKTTTANHTDPPPTTNVVAYEATGNPKAEALTNTQAGPAKTTTKTRPTTRRRKVKGRLRRKRPKTKKGGKVTPSDAKPKAEQVKTVDKIVIEPKAAPVAKAIMAPSANTATKAKAEKIAKTVVKAAKPVVKAKVEKKAEGFGQDMFFDMFTETTTVQPERNVPPPDFSVDKKPGIKVIPEVDTNNSKAYDGTPCNHTYKNHDTDKTKYMMKYAEGVWETLKCPPNLGSGLVWRQDLCSCGTELVAIDPNDWCAKMGFNPHLEKRHKYIRKDQGVNVVMDCAASLVWSQEKCLCMYDSTVKDRPIENQVTFVCKTILQMEFEGNLKNKAEGYHIQPVNLRRRGKLPRIRYRKVPGSTEKAAMIVSQPLEFLAFRGNDFQKQVTYAFNFKISPRHASRDNFMVLLTDECIRNPGGQNKASKPGIKLAFQPITKTFNLQFRSEKTDVDHLIKGAKADTYGWYKCVVYFEDNTLSMEVNGQTVFSQKDVMGKIPQNKCPLFIAGRGRGYDRSQDFYGYLDNVHLVKDCKFHEANIKFL